MYLFVSGYLFADPAGAKGPPGVTSEGSWDDVELLPA
jgi:hypothetical protein